MSGNEPVIPGEVPVFTGDEALLAAKVKALRGHGPKVSAAASSVHTTFGGLRAFYEAPEAEQLFATTKPVADKGVDLGSDLRVIAGALGTYADTIGPLVKRLGELRAQAVTFRERIAGDDEWREDGDLIDENLERRNAIAEVWTQFQEAERSCHAKIVALVGGEPLKINDGSNAKNMYGYDAEALKQAESLPWGDAVEESIPWYHIHEHAWEFGKGIVVDGLWGTIKGLGTLVGFDGWDAAGQAWTGLGKLLTGVVITAIPGVGAAYWAMPDDKLPAWLRDSRTAMKETGKALVAWDKWGSNPSRAAGEVTFNVLTTVFTGGAGGAVAGAGKAGAVAKTLSLTSKAGKAIDPMTYVFKGAGAGMVKIGDIMTGLKGAGAVDIPTINVDGAFALPDGARTLPDGTIDLPAGTPVPEGALKLPNGTIRLPEGTTTLPPGTVKLPVDGAARYVDPEGHLYDADGTLVQKAEDAPKEAGPTAGATTPHTTTPKPDTPTTAAIPERELAAVGARTNDDVLHLGSDTPDPLRPADDTPTARPDTTPGGTAPGGMPGGRANNGIPSNDLNAPRGGHSDTSPTTGTHTDAPPPGGAQADEPIIGRLRDTPSGTGHIDGAGGSTHYSNHPNTAGTSSLNDLDVGADDAPRAAGDTSTDNPVTGASDDSATRGEGPEESPGASEAKASDENPYAGQEPDHTRPALLPADGPLTLRDVRNTRDRQLRWQRGEEFHRQLWGGGTERWYPVPTNADARYPVTATGGRKVDVPVDLPDGRTVAVEVKTYGPYRTITMKDGTSKLVENKVPLKPEIKEQIHKDIALRNLNPDYDPRWSFTHAGPSDELRNYLEDAKIIFLEYGPAPKRDQWDPPVRKKK
ncbi:hypothetical protein [Streptomyces sp. CC228A]|uniref:hypothetical protein n=1 Tax=Streptomyces sp. CC228A TaxID=2898186 RepID=UPI001F2D444A|nr:hypothetical protein [Streptomyces sp. CC228A]